MDTNRTSTAFGGGQQSRPDPDTQIHIGAEMKAFCPHCGRCPTCGHVPGQYFPPYRYPYWCNGDIRVQIAKFDTPTVWC
jgi:hypothetical protein